MKVQIHDRVTVGKSSLENHAQRCVAATLSRSMKRLRRVFIEFSEADRDGYGVTTRCFIRVETTCGHTVAVDDTRHCAFLAVEKALRTVKRLVHGPAVSDERMVGALRCRIRADPHDMNVSPRAETRGSSTRVMSDWIQR